MKDKIGRFVLTLKKIRCRPLNEVTFNNDEAKIHSDDFKNCGICLIDFEPDESMTLLECFKEKDSCNNK